MPDNTTAFHLLLTGDPVLFSIVGLSLAVSLTASVVVRSSACLWELWSRSPGFAAVNSSSSG
jgi:ABC-type tungstate transport system substrate-binding protein